MKAALPIFTLALAALLLAPASSQAENGKVTYTKDVAPIFYEHCVTCHRPDQIAPFSLLEYDSARAWARSIRKAVHNRSMPPWHADSDKIAYANDRRLSDEEVLTIVQWVNHGAVEGDPADLPEPPTFNDDWGMGKPDYIFEADTDFVVTAGEDKIEYQTIHFTNDLTDDIYIKGWEIKPRYRKTVHHANLVHSPKKMKRVNIVQAAMDGGDYIGSYLPGAQPMQYPEGTALRIPAGHHIQIQVHYVGLEEDVVDRLQFGVRYADGRVDKLIRVCGTGEDQDIEIEPYDDDWTMTREIRLLHNTTILSAGAHMHLRGDAFTTTAILPDGTKKLVTEVPDYDFNWQSNYQLLNPVEVPAGTVYSVTAKWDNSAGNINNPDPSQKVVYGLWTENEMLNTWSHIVLTDEKLGLKIENGRIAGRYPDGVESKQPFLMQSLPGS